MTQNGISKIAFQALEAMEKAVQKLFRERKQMGQPVYILKNGRVTKIPAEKIVTPRLKTKRQN